MAERGRRLRWEVRQRIIRTARDTSIRGTAREHGVSRNTVRKVLRREAERRV